MNILAAGAFSREDPEQREHVREFCLALGDAIVTRGHVLLNGCLNELDKMVAEAAHQKLTELDADANRRIIGYVLEGRQPSHNYGTMIRSRLTDWEIASESFFIPEQLQEADVVVLVGGGEGTYRAANWARIAKKPLLPFTAFGGAASNVYAQELNEFDTKYAGLVDRLEYEQLNSLKSDWHEHAATIVSLAEKVAESRLVTVVMSYAERPDLVDAYDSFQQVVHELGYECERVSDKNAPDRIVPEILARIERAAFVLVDLTDLRPNVFYELGYAEGLRKRVIVTAKEGTELPFDVKDVPTIFWESQKKLKDDLTARIRSVVKTGIGSASLG
jgi:predicted Rossmann-fold nucleotide-binding protein